MKKRQHSTIPSLSQNRSTVFKMDQPGFFEYSNQQKIAAIRVQRALPFIAKQKPKVQAQKKRQQQPTTTTTKCKKILESLGVENSKGVNYL